jgi:hypothetical protein
MTLNRYIIQTDLMMNPMICISHHEYFFLDKEIRPPHSTCECLQPNETDYDSNSTAIRPKVTATQAEIQELGTKVNADEKQDPG